MRHLCYIVSDSLQLAPYNCVFISYNVTIQNCNIASYSHNWKEKLIAFHNTHILLTMWLSKNCDIVIIARSLQLLETHNYESSLQETSSHLWGKVTVSQYCNYFTMWHMTVSDNLQQFTHNYSFMSQNLWIFQRLRYCLIVSCKLEFLKM